MNASYSPFGTVTTTKRTPQPTSVLDTTATSAAAAATAAAISDPAASPLASGTGTVTGPGLVTSSIGGLSLLGLALSGGAIFLLWKLYRKKHKPAA